MSRIIRGKGLLPIGLLLLWLLLHAAVVFIDQRWLGTFALVLLSPVYIWSIHRLDAWFALGGVGSYLREVSRRVSIQPMVLPSGRERAALANQTVTITTGFAAILVFNTVRFHNDLQLRQDPQGASDAVLSVATVAFCVACVLNLIQLLILRLLDRKDVEENVKRRLRRRLRFFNAVAWHSLITPVILLLLLLGSPLPALMVNAFYGLSLFVYYFTAISESIVSAPPNHALEPTAPV